MLSFVFMALAVVFFLMHACGKTQWTFGSVTLLNIGFGLACLALAFLPSLWANRKSNP